MLGRQISQYDTNISPLFAKCKFHHCNREIGLLPKLLTRWNLPQNNWTKPMQTNIGRLHAKAITWWKPMMFLSSPPLVTWYIIEISATGIKDETPKQMMYNFPSFAKYLLMQPR